MDTDTLNRITKARGNAEELLSELRDIQSLDLDGIWVPEMLESLIRNLYYHTGVCEERLRREGQPQP